ncbi:myosin-15-like [Raphanus sativus]|uniref:Myosin-15-like n=1 Tax=Raphanus sativus TaxID=3726 RepID=A0A9W3D8V0_RAPSA|nr:myosin-15-like [Raphanus sativus]
MDLNLRKGDKVWVEDKDLAWIPGDVLDSSSGNKLHVETSTGKKVSVAPEKLFRRDPDEEEHNGVDDMTKLTYLHEPGVLYNLRGDTFSMISTLSIFVYDTVDALKDFKYSS